MEELLGSEGWAYNIRSKKVGHQLLFNIFQWTLREYVGTIDHHINTSPPFGRTVNNVPNIWFTLDVCDNGYNPIGDTGHFF
jgi:hypothetical protein